MLPVHSALFPDFYIIYDPLIARAALATDHVSFIETSNLASELHNTILVNQQQSFERFVNQLRSAREEAFPLAVTDMQDIYYIATYDYPKDILFTDFNIITHSPPPSPITTTENCTPSQWKEPPKPNTHTTTPAAFSHKKKNPADFNEVLCANNQTISDYLSQPSVEHSVEQLVSQEALQHAPSSPQQPPHFFSQSQPVNATATRAITKILANFFIITFSFNLLNRYSTK